MSVATATSTVRREYRHALKLVQPASTVALGDAVLKWYDIAPPDEPVTDDVRALARRAWRTPRASASSASATRSAS